MKFYKFIDVMIFAFGGMCGFLWGELDGVFYTLIAFVVLDYISGVIKAVHQKKLSSEMGFKGICKKLMIFIVVAVANIIDVQVIKDGSVVRTAVLFLFIANEGISLLENASAIGLPIPQKLVDTLNQLKVANGGDSGKSGSGNDSDKEDV